MAEKAIPVYDICSISGPEGEKDLLVERLSTYLNRHYGQLHHAHRHSFYHLVLFTGGKGHHTIDFQRFELAPSQMYFMSPGQVHSWHFEAGAEGFLVHFNEAFFTSFLKEDNYLDRFPFFQSIPAACVCDLSPSATGRVITVFEAMLKEMEGKTPDYLDMIRLRLLELFILVERDTAHGSTAAARGPKHALLRSYQQLIQKHFRTLKLPRQYAELLYVTPNHLNALCQELLGKTAGDLIRERVLLEAKRLLTNAGWTVAQIAAYLDFADNSYFNRYFKKAEGITPESFRKKFLQQ